MRTTITLDPDVEALVKKRMEERHQSFKQAINDALREQLAGGQGEPFHQQTFHLGFNPAFNLDKALQLAGDIEDEEIVAKTTLGR